MLRVVQTKNGTVRGIEAADPRITAFKGIPFAAPPVGENRWRAPQPAADWDGVKECYRFKAIAMQDTPGLGDGLYDREWHVDSEVEISEDCLYLNVWTSAKTGKEKMPVVVWYFGGGLQWGYPSEMEFDGERVARRGVVVVSVNYRLGAFGFLAHPEITKNQPDAPSNFGYLDQQAGLDWVIANIEAFGGDPENITIAGQSAGGGSVLNQIAAPSNKGKIKKAIIQSAIFGNPFVPGNIFFPTPLAEAEKKGEEFFEFMGVKTLEEARKLDALFIRAKYAEFAKDHPRFFNNMDGKFCVGDPQTMIANGAIDDIQIMAGNTSEEFMSPVPDEYKEIVGADSIVGIEPTIKSLFERAEENGNTLNNYYYQFDADIPGDDKPGNFHSVELWFFFETLAKCHRAYVGHHYDLARKMCNYWSNFIKTGDPNGTDSDGTPMEKWDAYKKANPCSMHFLPEGPKAVCEQTAGERLMIDKGKEFYK